MNNGVSEYEEATVSIFFEKEHVACKFCPLLETYSRNQCRRTGEYILDVNHGTGRWCPLAFENENPF
jgi:hypothetical protein